MNKKTRKLFTWCLVVALVVTQMLFANVAFAATSLKGTDRYQTALEIVKAGWTKSDNAVIARGDDLADALAAAPLAYAKGKAPILLTETGALPTGVLDELSTLGVKNVYIVGGTGAVSQAVEDALKAKVTTVTRIFGADRAATSLKVAEAAFPTAPAKAVIVNGYAYADALSISSIAAASGMPILLVDKDSKSADVATYLTGKTVYAVGGAGVISDAVAGTATRLSGADRYATNVAVLKAFTLDYSKVFVAVGEDANCVDALGGAAYAAVGNNPMVLVNGALTTDASDLLKANVKADTTVVTLGGVVPASVATAIEGLKPTTLTATVSAVAADTLKVAFNRAVDTTKATFEVKKGSVKVNYDTVAWNDAKTEATITLFNNMVADDYTVTVSGLTDTALTSKVTVQDQKVAKIEFSSDKLVQASTISSGNLVADPTSATVEYKLFDQYGTDVTSDFDSEMSFATTVGNVDDWTDGVLTLSYGAGFTLDSKVIVNALDTTSGAYANTTLTVAPIARVAKITLGNLTPNEDVTDTELFWSSSNNNFGDFYIPVTAEDQYGNALTNASVFNADVQPILANMGATVSYDSTLETLKASLSPAVNSSSAVIQTTGTATLTFIGKGTGVKADKSLTVNKYGEVADFSIDLPSLLVAGDTTAVEVPFTAVDQYGKAVTDATALNTLIHSASVTGVTGLDENDFTFAKDYKTNTTKLHVNLAGLTVTSATKVYVNMVVNTYKLYSTTFTVQPNAVPTTIAGTQDGATYSFIANVVKDASGTLAADNFVVKDQYGREMDLPSGYSIDLTTSDDAKVALGGSDTASVNSSTTTTLDAVAVGSATIKATLNDGTDPVSGSSYSFTAKTVNASDVKTFEVAALGTLYAPTATDTDYQKDIVITGKLADGSKVVLNTNVIKSVLSTNTSVLTIEGTLAAPVAVATPVASSRPTDDATAAVVVTVDGAEGPVVINTPVTVSYGAPVATTIKADSDNVTDGVYYVQNANVDTAANQFVITDQYGVDITGTTPGTLTYVVTNVVTADTAATVTTTTAGNITLSTGTHAVANGDYFTLTAITPNGKSLSIKVVIDPSGN